MEDTQGSYNHEEEIIGLHVNMGNVEIVYNGRRDGSRYYNFEKLAKRSEESIMKG
jgi:hypothetical protein